MHRGHYSIGTRQSYIDRIKRFIYFRHKQPPRHLNESHCTEFLNFLVVHKKWQAPRNTRR
ncbi:MAG: phage integrase N-terminal SAM-like domain-containing protein [Candidatus Promineifilaceae bacterium]